MLASSSANIFFVATCVDAVFEHAFVIVCECVCVCAHVLKPYMNFLISHFGI